MAERGLVKEFITGNDPELEHLETIGDGFFGEVHKLRHAKKHGGKAFARKVKPLFGPLSPKDRESDERLVNKVLRLPHHKNLVGILDHGLLQSHKDQVPLPFYTIDTELCGENLRQYIENPANSENGGSLSLPGVWSIIQQIASGAEYLYRNDIDHPHLRSENIVRSLGPSQQNIWKITNFCNSRRLLIIEDLEGEGIPQYHPPELIFSRRKPDGEQAASVKLKQNRACSWSLGCILYELCTGGRAFPDLYSLLQYYSNNNPVPKVTEDSNPKLFGTSRILSDSDKSHIAAMWSSVNGANIPLFGNPKDENWMDSVTARINKMIELSLNKNVSERLSIEEIEFYSAANVIRTKLETVEAYVSLATEALINHPPTARYESVDLTRLRWRFLVQIEHLCSNDHHNTYKRLSETVQNPSTQNKYGLKNLFYDNPQLAENFQSLFIGPFNFAEPSRRDTEGSGSTASSGTEDYTWVAGGCKDVSWVENIGTGVVTDVHKIFNHKTGRYLARKVTKLKLTGDESQKEIKIWQEGKHPNLILVLGLSSYSNFVFIDMVLYVCNLSQYLDNPKCIHWSPAKGRSLEKRALQARLSRIPLPTQEAIDIIKQLMNGIAYLHSRKVTHQNLKPENGIIPNACRLMCAVLYCKVDNVWKIAEFPNDLNSDGRLKRTGQTHSGHSVSYQAPELLEPEDETTNSVSITNKVDIWSLGCILCELVSGEKAFPGIAAIRKYCKGESLLPLTLDIGDAMKEIILKMLVPNASDRPSADMLLNHFSRFTLETFSRVVGDSNFVATPQCEDASLEPPTPLENPDRGQPTPVKLGDGNMESDIQGGKHNDASQVNKDGDAKQFSRHQGRRFYRLKRKFGKVFQRNFRRHL